MTVWNLHIKLLLIGMMWASTSFGQLVQQAPDETPRPPVQYDTIDPKRTDTADITKPYYEDEAYRYGRDKEKKKMDETVFDRLWSALWDRTFDPPSFDKTNFESPFNWQNLFIIILVIVLVWAILQATKSGVSGIFKGKSRSKEEVTDATLEDVDIYAINYEQEIADAQSRGDYRLAVRLWYLRMLKEMSEKELIHWRTDKTNLDYERELRTTPYAQRFGKLSLFYDYVWYGEFVPDRSQYGNAEEEFKLMLNQIAKK
jgi:Domain of unknown function (DUF4129)